MKKKCEGLPLLKDLTKDTYTKEEVAKFMRRNIDIPPSKNPKVVPIEGEKINHDASWLLEHDSGEMGRVTEISSEDVFFVSTDGRYRVLLSHGYSTNPRIYKIVEVSHLLTDAERERIKALAREQHETNWK